MGARRSWFVSLVLVVALVLAPSVGFAAIRGRIVEGVGIKTAKLGLHDSTNVKRIGRAYKRIRDDSYAGQTVYLYRFRTRLANKKYPVRMWSHGNHHVFAFEINCTTLKTKNGTHVGTTETRLIERYGSKLKKSTTPTYTKYYMGTRKGRTEFWVKGGKVHHIVIMRY